MGSRASIRVKVVTFSHVSADVCEPAGQCGGRCGCCSASTQASTCCSAPTQASTWHCSASTQTSTCCSASTQTSTCCSASTQAPTWPLQDSGGVALRVPLHVPRGEARGVHLLQLGLALVRHHHSSQWQRSGGQVGGHNYSVKYRSSTYKVGRMSSKSSLHVQS